MMANNPPKDKSEDSAARSPRQNGQASSISDPAPVPSTAAEPSREVLSSAEPELASPEARYECRYRRAEELFHSSCNELEREISEPVCVMGVIRSGPRELVGIGAPRKTRAIDFAGSVGYGRFRIGIFVETFL